MFSVASLREPYAPGSSISYNTVFIIIIPASRMGIVLPRLLFACKLNTITVHPCWCNVLTLGTQSSIIWFVTVYKYSKLSLLFILYNTCHSTFEIFLIYRYIVRPIKVSFLNIIDIIFSDAVY